MAKIKSIKQREAHGKHESASNIKDVKDRVDYRISVAFVISVLVCHFIFQPGVEKKIFIQNQNKQHLTPEAYSSKAYISDMKLQPRGPDQENLKEESNKNIQLFSEEYKIAMSMKNNGKMKSFVSHARKALKVDTMKTLEIQIARAELLFEIAVYQNERGKVQSAEKSYMEIIKMGRLRLDIDQASRFNLGIVMTQNGKFIESIPVLKEVVDIDDTTDLAKLASHNLGTVLRAVGNIDDAIRYFKHALSIEHDALPPLKELIQSLRLIGQTAEADRHEQRLCELDKFACPHNKQKFFVIGERNSGTNWVSSLLTLNFPAQLHPLPPEINGTPWKHSTFDDSELDDWLDFENTLIVGIIKDPFAWFHSMKKRPWHAVNADALKELPFADAVMLPWESKLLAEDGRVLTESYPNMAALRSAKLLALKRLVERRPQHVLICKYEELLDGNQAESTFTSFFAKHGILKQSGKQWESISFPIHGNNKLPVDHYENERYEKVNAERYHYYIERKYMEPIMEETDDSKMCAMLRALDFDLEKWAGYDLSEDIETFC
mmetsp:Transcript_10082/g.13189  ORF Transcript_10082/g.13189 Transcript_10082/m.13189 type:complete len:549 (-) Transcript_10082:177-1823(-)